MVLGSLALLLGMSIVFGSGVSDKLAVGGYNAPASESTHAAELLDQNFGTNANLVIQLLPREGTIEGPDAVDVARRMIELVTPSRRRRSSGRSPTIRPPTCAAGTDVSGLMLVHVGGTADEAADTAKRIIAASPTTRTSRCVQAALSVSNRRSGTKSNTIQGQRKHRVAHFAGRAGHRVRRPDRRVAAARVGIISIVTTLFVFVLMTTITDVSMHALTVATAFGLGLSIDFGLLMVSRFREERDNGKDHQQPIIATVATAGRTIIFSAATVTLAMLSLLVFPTYFLRSVGIAASATVLLSALSAIIVLPAMLALLGTASTRWPSSGVRRRFPPIPRSGGVSPRRSSVALCCLPCRSS